MEEQVTVLALLVLKDTLPLTFLRHIYTYPRKMILCLGNAYSNNFILNSVAFMVFVF